MGKRKNLIQLLDRLLETPRPVKRGICVTLDAFLLFGAYLGAKALRVGTLEFPSTLEEWGVISTTIAVSIYIFARTGLYRAILRHLAPQAMTTVLLGVMSSTVTLVALSFFLRADIPRTVPVIYAAIALIAIGGTRYMVRNIIIGMQRWQKQKVIIYGAGNAGSQLASALHFGQAEKLGLEELRGHPRYAEWIAAAGTEWNLYVATHEMSFSTESQREAAQRDVAREYQPEFGAPLPNPELPGLRTLLLARAMRTNQD